MHPRSAIIVLWCGWALSWLVASAWSDRTEKRVGLRSEVAYRVVLLLGAVLLAVPAHGYEGILRLWRVSWLGAWTCVAFVSAGFGFCWWARFHLGRLWSGNITKKSEHHIVDTGPYRVVRHPIYTGILVATLATMSAKGTLPGVLGASLIVLGLWMKARLEERWLRQEVGAEAYAAYSRRVPMLVPFAPHSKRTP